MITPISTLLPYLDQEYREVLLLLLSDAGGNETWTLAQLLTYYPDPSKLSRDYALALLALMGAYHKMVANKFSPKLTFSQRCEILGLIQMGFSRESLSYVYKIDRRTITHIWGGDKTHYKNVREEYHRLGKQKFIEKYVTPDVINTAMSYKAIDGAANNKYANKKAGFHLVKGKNCTYNHRVGIQWIEHGSQIATENNLPTSGWYYRDMDGDLPDSWFTAGDESMKSSQACYLAMLDDISDKIE